MVIAAAVAGDQCLKGGSKPLVARVTGAGMRSGSSRYCHGSVVWVVKDQTRPDHIAG
jgi:hypothetical protein